MTEMEPVLVTLSLAGGSLLSLILYQAFVTASVRGSLALTLGRDGRFGLFVWCLYSTGLLAISIWRGDCGELSLSYANLSCFLNVIL